MSRIIISTQEILRLVGPSADLTTYVSSRDWDCRRVVYDTFYSKSCP